MKKKTILNLLFVFLFTSILSFFSITAYQIQALNFSEAEKDFLYLAKILKSETKGLESIEDKLQKMTDWLHENVKHGAYPPNFNGKGVANVIRGGMGNCGYQSCNIAAFAELLGFKEHRLIHNREEWGAPGMHTFAEIKIDNEWVLFDPDWWQYLTDKKENLIGVKEVIQDTSSVTNKEAAQFIFNTFKNKGYKITPSWQKTPMPYGDEGYLNYDKYGMAYIYKTKLESKTGLILFLSIFLSSVLTLIAYWFKRT